MSGEYHKVPSDVEAPKEFGGLPPASTQLEQREQQLVPNLETGELLDLKSADSSDIAHALFAIKQKEQELESLRNTIGEELHRRMDADACWTQHWGAFDVVGRSPAPSREPDIEPLKNTLAELVVEGRITEEAAFKALTVKEKWTPKWGAIDAIRKLSPEVKERIDKHIREVEKKRYAPSVSLVRPELPK